MGVARDIRAGLLQSNVATELKTPSISNFRIDKRTLKMDVSVKDAKLAPRYCGVTISGITVKPSPNWLQNRLKAIGIAPKNNIVDVTNYVLHELGQPLHAFDASKIKGNKVIVQTLKAGTKFVTLDDIERTLHEEDLMICDENGPMCFAGVFGGKNSGVSDNTSSIFLESAWFENIHIRKTSVHHGLRTDAATRFEKGVDISNTVNVLKRAALLIKEVAGGEISGDIIDIYPNPKAKTPVSIKYHYIKKISGKNYHPDAVKKILEALGFEVLRDGIDELQIAVPFSKPDISLPADIVEEILRIDGIDSIEIPTTITLSPSINTLASKERLKDKIANYLVGQGFNEILTNSITNSKYYTEEVLAQTVKMVNSLSVDLDIMRPSLLETGLETISFNMNRRNNNLQFFEIGKTYLQKEVGFYIEEEHLALYLTGNNHEDEWREKSKPNDLYRAKGIAASILTLGGFNDISFAKSGNIIEILNGKQKLGTLEEVAKNKLNQFDIKQAVIYIDIEFGALLKATEKQKIVYKEVPKFPAVQRDLALIVDSNVQFDDIENIVTKQKNTKLQSTRLFDVFESDKLGVGKKSMAINFTFLDEEKTLTDKEVEGMTNRLIQSFEKEIGAEIRK
jgi:phenylalanyl-tRNA synthetase beta chain